MSAKKEISSADRYLIYLHGAIVEGQHSGVTSPIWGPYQVDEIVARFRCEGFNVISEIRPVDTDVGAYATKVTTDIAHLISKGVSPEHITVVGGSKGAVIAMVASHQLQNRFVHWVLLGGCQPSVIRQYPNLTLWGYVLSIYEATDPVGRSCSDLQLRSTQTLTLYRELQIQTGESHGFQFRPYDEWIKPTIQWAQGHYDVHVP